MAVEALSPSRAGSGDEDLALGSRIREARLHRNLSVAELAGLASVSKSLVSQIERGVAAPSLDTVRKIASALQVPVFSLFLEGPDSEMVVRRQQRRVVRYPGSKVTREVLTPSLHGRMVLLWVTFPSGERSRREPVRHVGEECVVVVRGSLEVAVGEQSVVLNDGDSMVFDPNVPHTFRNPTRDATEIITAITPPNI